MRRGATKGGGWGKRGKKEGEAVGGGAARGGGGGGGGGPGGPPPLCRGRPDRRGGRRAGAAERRARLPGHTVTARPHPAPRGRAGRRPAAANNERAIVDDLTYALALERADAS